MISILRKGFCYYWCICMPVMAAEVVVNDSASNFALPPTELRLIFSKQKTLWPNGQPITVYMLEPSSELHKEFCIKTLDLMPYILQRRWDRLIYSGTGERPLLVKSEQEMRDKVRSTAGAIGYISGNPGTQGVADVSYD